MPLNCKPGQLARVINSPGAQVAGLVDKIVRVGRVTSSVYGDPCWSYEGPRLRCACCRLPISDIADACLRPIDNPPNDAVDESLTWCPRPEQVEAMS